MVAASRNRAGARMPDWMLIRDAASNWSQEIDEKRPGTEERSFALFMRMLEPWRG